MKKILTLLLAFMMLFAIASCSQNKQDDNKKPDDTKPVTATPKEIDDALAKALGNGYLCTVDVPKDDILASPLSGVDLTKIDSYVVKQAVVSAVDQDSVVIVKCKDASYADEVVTIFNENYSRIIDYIRQYPFGVAKVEGARIYKVGNIVMFILAGASADENASDENAAKLAVSEYAKIDKVIKDIFGSVPANLAVIPEPSDNNGGFNFDDYDFEDYDSAEG